MRRQGSLLFLFTAVCALSAAALRGCAPAPQVANAPAPAASPAAPAGGKIPVTTSSEEARKEFLQGRDKAERLLAQVGRANAAQTAKEFFEHLKKAVALSGKASEGERLLIVATEAGANGEAAKQKEHLDKLVAAHPGDERAHFNLGGYHFGQQDFKQAIEHYKKATELAPNYSPAYNILGYAYRQNGDYANAEQAFKKYIDLIPNDPNPYDSYAELLLKMGKYEDSITQYRKALSLDPNFVASRNGIAADLLYMGKPDEALAELQALNDKARSDGDRRTALFGMTVVQADGGKLDKALEEVEKQYALGEKINDTAAMTGDLQLKGNILAEMGRYDEAKEQFDRLLKMTEESALSQEIKQNAKLFHHYNLVTVALGKKDYAAAKAEAEEFRKGAEGSKNPNQMRQTHELAGIIALAEKDYDKAVAELQQANPQNLYRLSQAFQGKGDNAKAKEFASKAAGFNSLPQLNYAFVRTKAQKVASDVKG